jgi:serine/threonine protein kinase
MSGRGEEDVPFFPGRYVAVGLLGTGFAGDVWSARSEDSACGTVAIKTVCRELYLKHDLSFPPNEIAFLTELSCPGHPNVVRMLHTIEGPDRIFLVQELLSGGDLFVYQNEVGLFSEFMAWCLFSDMLAGVAYIHGHGIVHRDLKGKSIFCIRPRSLFLTTFSEQCVGDCGFVVRFLFMSFLQPENCVLDEEGTLKIVDFGLAARWKPGQLLHEFCGCAEYAAPEVLREEPHEGPPVDVWALGVMLFDMVMGRLPFEPDERSFAAPAALDQEASPELAALLRAALHARPSARATLTHLAASSWMDLGRAGKMQMTPADGPPPDTPLGRRLQRECSSVVDGDMAF